MSLPQVPVREGYDRWAPYYDDYDNALIALEQPIVEALLGSLAGARVVELGCGTGRWTLSMAAKGAAVTGIDFSAGMLEVLRAKPGAESVELIEADLREGLPLPADAFDLALASLVLEHVDALGAAFAELGRIARPGGRIVIADFHPEMIRRGMHARFRAGEGADKVQIEGAEHTISDYVMAALGAGLELETLAEYRMDEATAARSRSASKYVGEPMLLTLVARVPD